MAIDTIFPHHPERIATRDGAVDELTRIDEATYRVLLQRRLPRRARDRLTAMLKDAVEPMLRSAGRVPVAYDFRGWHRLRLTSADREYRSDVAEALERAAPK
ncbi:MAG TPA: hypothetical protein VFL55_20750 [Acetobacteraceae bacterium]|nr:hypothetical protein [Acetobacteraceae bacterium]